MADDKDKTVTEEPAEEAKVEEVEEAKVEKPAEELAEEPKVEEPVEKPAEEPSGAAAPADDTAAPVGTDQQGRQLYSVKCSNCGKQTEVPFKPSGDRPVYCRDCYLQKKGAR